ISASTVRPEHHVYFTAREHLQRVSHWIERTRESLSPKKTVRPVRRRAVVTVPAKTGTLRIGDLRARWSALFSTSDVFGLLQSAAEDLAGAGGQTQWVLNIRRQTILLAAMLGEHPRVVLLLRWIEENAQLDCEVRAKVYEPLFAAMPALDVAM